MSTQPTPKESTADQLSEYVHFAELPKLYPNILSLSRIQWLIRNRDINGLDQHLVRIGRQIYVHLPSFADWLNSQRGRID